MVLILADSNMQEKILNSIGANPKSLNEGVSALQHWLERQPHLPKNEMSKNVLKSILVNRKNSVEKSKQYIDNYWSARHIYPELYFNRNPLCPEIQEDNKFIQYYTLPKLTPEGLRVSILNFASGKPNAKAINTLMTRILMIFDLRYKIDIYRAGEYLILDAKNFNFTYMFALQPNVISKCMYFIQDAKLTRLKKIIFINVNPYAEKIIKTMKLFLNKKFEDRIEVYEEDYSVLYQYIPKEILPMEYKGSAGKIEDLNNAWQKLTESEYEYLITIGQQKSDESKRPKDSIRKETIFGIDGNFKKLDID